uniref:Nucleoside diphosphate kinase 1 n=1 Tax=Oryza brachyantha TaxID=4533 RepID=J3N4Y6_ORYBR
MATEQTFIMIKPDGVQRGLIGEVISRFEKKGFYLKAMKLINVEKSFAEKHYADLSSKPFFGGLVEYIVSGPVVAMVWEGKQVVATGRKLVGATNPLAAEPGTIRGDFAVDIGMSSTGATQSRTPGRRSPCGSLRALPSGGATSTLGSMRSKMPCRHASGELASEDLPCY